MSDNLKALVAAELAEPVQPAVAAMAEAIAARYGEAARAVLFYGSCLRTAELDGMMLDFYLIVSDYRTAYGKSWLASANRLIPPNVFPFEHGGMAAKYAVLSEADFRRECGPKAPTVSVWARFAQPSRLVWAADAAARESVVESVALAAPTLLSYALPMVNTSSAQAEPVEAVPFSSSDKKDRASTSSAQAEGEDALEVWRRGFALTYTCELRAERKDRSSSIVDAEPQRYRRFGEAAMPRGPAMSRAAGERLWARLRRTGKRTTVLRLLKASGTFAGGIDYLAWKINRHAGTEIRITPWQRRHPILAAFTLLPRLMKRGAVR